MVKYYEYIISENKAFADITNTHMMSIQKYKQQLDTIKKINCPFKMPKIETFEFKNKLMFDNNIQYNYNIDVLYYDIEACKLSGTIAEMSNKHSFITMIQFMLVTAKETQLYVYTLKKYENYINMKQITEQYGFVNMKYFSTE
jgi:hypothetical protein